MKGHIMTATDEMMKFRTVYLQAISKSWRDSSFLSKLTEAPVLTLKKEFGYTIPWNLYVEIKTAPPEASMWEPDLAGGWVGPNAVVSVWLPPAPSNPDEFGKAWAAFYNEFPSLLVPKEENYYKEVLSEITTEEDGEQMVGQAYQLGMGQANSFLEFGGVTMRLIAMMWNDQRVREDLSAMSGDRVLNKWLGYNIPWNMDIEFNLTDDPKFRWNEKKGKWPSPRPRKCQNGLRFYIPNAPGDDPSIDAIALSAYNVTGDQYPFTCP